MNGYYQRGDSQSRLFRQFPTTERDNNCSHVIIHKSCRCSPHHYIGVCKKCLEVFCSSGCLELGERHGAVEPKSMEKFGSDFDYQNKNGGNKMPMQQGIKSPSQSVGSSGGLPLHRVDNIHSSSSQSDMDIGDSRPAILAHFDTPQLFPPGGLGRGRGKWIEKEKMPGDPIERIGQKLKEFTIAKPPIAPTLVFRSTRGRGRGAAGTFSSDEHLDDNNASARAIVDGIEAQLSKPLRNSDSAPKAQLYNLNYAPISTSYKTANLQSSGATSSLPINFEQDIPLGVKTVLNITHVQDCSTLYFQWERSKLVFDNEKLQRLGENSLLLPAHKIKSGEYCIVDCTGNKKKTKEKGFYRGKIIQSYNNCCDVQLVDIGSVVQVDGNQLREISNEFLSQRRLAARVGLKGIVPKKDSAWKTVLSRKLAAEETAVVLITHFNVQTEASNKTRYWGNVYGAGDQDIGKFLVTLGDAEFCDSEIPFDDTTKFLSALDNSLGVIETPLGIGSSYPAQICPGAKSANDFYIIRDGDESLFNKLSKACGRLSSMGHNAYNPWRTDSKGYGDLCIVWHPDRKKFYRGRVRMIDCKLFATVYLIDSGEEVKCPLTDVKELDSSLKVYKPLAYHCKLPLALNAESEKHFMKRFYRMNEFRVGGLLAKILCYESDGYYIVDFKLPEEMASFCKAVLTLGEATIASESMLRLIQEGIEEGGSVTADNRIVKPTLWTMKAESQGVHLESLKGIKDFVECVSQPTNSRLEEIVPKYNFQKLIPLPLTQNLRGKVCLFNRLVGFNMYTLMDKLEGQELTERLESAITQCIQTGNGQFEKDENPEIGDIVLSPGGGRNCFRRSIVEGLISSSKIVKVRLLEYGTTAEWSAVDLRKPNDAVMQVPLFVHFVQLSAIQEDIPILVQEFRALRSNLKSTAVLSSVKENKRSGIPIVLLLQEKTEVPIHEMIRDLSIWQWRKLHRGLYTNFTELLEKSGQPKSIENFFMKNKITETMKRATVEIQIRTVGYSNQDIFISGIPLDDIITYQNRTVYHQVKLFIDKISDSELSGSDIKNYPNMMGAKLSEERLKTDTFPTLCTWHRTFYNVDEEILFCVDCFWSTGHENGEFPGLTVRRLTVDFYAPCPMGMICKIPGGAIDDKALKEAAKKLFPKGKIVKVNIKSKVPTVEGYLHFYPAEVVMSQN